jgi:site-specific DNA-methyltransferase (adenine-specific)
MSTIHICERCGKNFKQKNRLVAHMKRKRPCKKEDSITEIVEEKSNELLNIRINEEGVNDILTKNMEEKVEDNVNEVVIIPTTEELHPAKKDKKEQHEKEMIEINKETLEDSKTDNISLLHGDCLKRMLEIPDNSVDLILCDLPYGSTRCKWDSIINLNELWGHYKRIIKKPSGVILLFGQQPFTSMLVSSNYDWFKYTIIWKKNKTTQYLLANYRPMKCTEDICVFSSGGSAAASRHKGNMTYNPQGIIPVDIKKKNSKERIGKMLNQTHHLGPKNKLTGNSEYSQKFTNYPTELIEFDVENDTIHETQKPVKLIEYLIKTYSNEGDTVLDNTMGSGTTGIGCKNTNRKFIGIEMNDLYFKLSKYRIARHSA